MINRIRQYLDGEGFVAKTTEEARAEIALLDGGSEALSRLDALLKRGPSVRDGSFYRLVAQMVGGISIYDWFKAAGRSLVEKKLEILIDRGYVANGMKVLDVGCGTGLESVFFGQVVGPAGSVLGIDSSRGMIGAARARLKKSGLRNVAFKVADRERLPVQDGSQDSVMVLGGSLIEGDNYEFQNGEVYLNLDLARRLGEIGRALKMDGRVFVSAEIPNYDTHIKYETARMRSILEQTGFEPEFLSVKTRDVYDKEKYTLIACGTKVREAA